MRPGLGWRRGGLGGSPGAPGAGGSHREADSLEFRPQVAGCAGKDQLLAFPTIRRKGSPKDPSSCEVFQDELCPEAEEMAKKLTPGAVQCAATTSIGVAAPAMMSYTEREA